VKSERCWQKGLERGEAQEEVKIAISDIAWRILGIPEEASQASHQATCPDRA